MNMGQESSPQHCLLPFRRQRCSTVAAGGAPFDSVTAPRDVGDGFQSRASASAAVLEHANSVVPRAKPSNSTSTLRGGDGFLSSVHSHGKKSGIFPLRKRAVN